MKFFGIISSCLLILIALTASVANSQTYSNARSTKSSDLILNYSYTNNFSDLSHKDTFSISLTGKSIVTGRVTFKIVDFRGKNIFTEKFTAKDLLGDLIDVKSSVKQQEDTIKNRMKIFFRKGNFKQPAIENGDTFDGDYSNAQPSDKKDWEALKANRESIGFIYSYGYEGTYGIAWLKNKKKVFLYFYSD